MAESKQYKIPEGTKIVKVSANGVVTADGENVTATGNTKGGATTPIELNFQGGTPEIDLTSVTTGGPSEIQIDSSKSKRVSVVGATPAMKSEIVVLGGTVALRNKPTHVKVANSTAISGLTLTDSEAALRVSPSFSKDTGKVTLQSNLRLRPGNEDGSLTLDALQNGKEPAQKVATVLGGGKLILVNDLVLVDDLGVEMHTINPKKGFAAEDKAFTAFEKKTMDAMKDRVETLKTNQLAEIRQGIVDVEKALSNLKIKPARPGGAVMPKELADAAELKARGNLLLQKQKVLADIKGIIITVPEKHGAKPNPAELTIEAKDTARLREKPGSRDVTAVNVVYDVKKDGKKASIEVRYEPLAAGGKTVLKPTKIRSVGDKDWKRAEGMPNLPTTGDGATLDLDTKTLNENAGGRILLSDTLDKAKQIIDIKVGHGPSFGGRDEMAMGGDAFKAMETFASLATGMKDLGDSAPHKVTGVQTLTTTTEPGTPTRGLT